MPWFVVLWDDLDIGLSYSYTYYLLLIFNNVIDVFWNNMNIDLVIMYYYYVLVYSNLNRYPKIIDSEHFHNSTFSAHLLRTTQIQGRTNHYRVKTQIRTLINKLTQVMSVLSKSNRNDFSPFGVIQTIYRHLQGYLCVLPLCFQHNVFHHKWHVNKCNVSQPDQRTLYIFAPVALRGLIYKWLSVLTFQYGCL